MLQKFGEIILSRDKEICVATLSYKSEKKGCRNKKLMVKTINKKIRS